MYFVFNAVTTLFANIIQDPCQEAVEADRILMRTTVDLLYSPKHKSEPDILSLLGHLHQILDKIIGRSIERVSLQNSPVERPPLDAIGIQTDHDQLRVSLAPRLDEQ